MSSVAVVTGGAGGIGAGAVGRLASDGWHVLAADVSDEHGLALADEVPGSVYARLDVTSPGDWEAAVKVCEDTFGAVPALLVNCAGINRHVPVWDETLEAYTRIVQINQIGTFLGIRTMSRVMRPGSGIINIASINTFRGLRDSVAYAATKAAVLAMTRAAAHDLAPRGIRVNSVSPGLVATPMVSGGISEALDSATTQALRVPGEMATPADIAAAIAFLASAESKHVNGADLLIDGGVTFFGAGSGH